MTSKLESLDLYVADYPDPAVAVDLFKGEWSSRLPGIAEESSGPSPLFDDPRMAFWINSVKRVFPNSLIRPDAFSVLELGPLEGGHTYQMAKESWDIVAIEANTRAFIRCLLVANMYHIKARFLLGNFEKYIADLSPQQSFDFMLASGVLYHLKKPTETLRRLLRATKSIGIWSHYASSAYADSQPGRWEQVEYFDSCAGKMVPGFMQSYGQALSLSSYCGGSAPYSVWMTKDQIMEILNEFGFIVDVEQDIVDSASGPSITLFAYKSV